MRIIVLNENKYPEYFYDHPVSTMNPTFDFDTTIINRINEYNPKLKIEALVYRNTNIYLDSNMGKYFGLIMELTEIQLGEEVATDNSFEYEGNTYKYTIFGYIFMSLNIESSRDIFVSQQIFPYLTNLLTEIQDCETFEISAKPLFFINLVNKRLTAKTILRDLELIQLAGINVIHLFNDWILDINLSHSLEELNSRYPQNIYSYDEINNEIFLKLDELQRNIRTNHNGDHIFHGSSEKFYSLSALCIAKFACNIGIKLNVDEISTFRRLYANEIEDPRKSKFSNINALFNYLEKLAKKKEYFNV